MITMILQPHLKINIVTPLFRPLIQELIFAQIIHKVLHFLYLEEYHGVTLRQILLYRRLAVIGADHIVGFRDAARATLLVVDEHVFVDLYRGGAV